MNKTKLEKGITLIALVITIIVLLILAGISISMLTGENGILNRAVTAREKTRRGEIIEDLRLKIYEKQLSNKGKITETELREILEEKGKLSDEENILDRTLTTEKEKYEIKVSEIWNGNLMQEEQTEKTVMDYAKKAMPTGAHIDESTNEETGIVMIDSNENEWVWIEVPEEVFETATSSTDYENIEADLIKYTQSYTAYEIYCVDKWYDRFGTIYDGKDEYSYIQEIQEDFDFDSAKDYYGTIYKDNQGTEIAEEYEWETYYAKITDKLNDTLGCGLTYENYNINYKKMLSSIYTNKGFYIARYEAGIEGSDKDVTKARTDSSLRIDDTTISNVPKVVSKKDMIPYNYIYCSEAQTLASNMATGGKTSSLMFGLQWNLVCKYLEVNGNWDTTEYQALYYINENSISWGNYYDATFTINSVNAKQYNSDKWESISGTISGGSMLTTGASEYMNKMNIYDFAGNGNEWTLEHYESDQEFIGPCTYRGVGMSGTYIASASFHTSVDSINYGENTFRSSLY